MLLLLLWLLRRQFIHTQVGVYTGLALKVWDLGGQANLRPSWQTYYKATDAVIMVVDSTDRARVGIAKVSDVFSVSALSHLAEMHLMIYLWFGSAVLHSFSKLRQNKFTGFCLHILSLACIKCGAE